MMTLISTTIRQFAVFLRDMSFWKWISIFGILGLVGPVIYEIHYVIFGTSLGGFDTAKWLWPTSIALMGLDTPNPSLVVIVLTYAKAVLGNVVLFGLIGTLIWPLVLVLSPVFRSHEK